MRWTNGSYEIDDDRSRLDMDRIVTWLAESYWVGTQPEAAGRFSDSDATSLPVRLSLRCLVSLIRLPIGRVAPRPGSSRG